MKHRHATNFEAVETLLATRRPDPRFAAADQVAGAAALRLAEVLDATDNGSSAANLSRELRQVLELLRLTEVDPLPSPDELRQQRQAMAAEAEWNAMVADLGLPVRGDRLHLDPDPPARHRDDGDDGDDGDEAGPVHAW